MTTEKITFEQITHEWMFGTSSKWRELFHKWNLFPGFIVAKFKVDPRIRADNETHVINALLADTSMRTVLDAPSTSTGCHETFSIEKLSCSFVNMKPLTDALLDKGKHAFLIDNTVLALEYLLCSRRDLRCLFQLYCPCRRHYGGRIYCGMHG